MDFRLYIWPHYVLEYDGHRIPLTKLEGAILSRLGRGRGVTFEQLTDSLYSDREDGGPEDPDNVIAVTVCRIRKKLSKSPVRIGRARYGEYRLLSKFGATIDRISDTIVAEGMGAPVAKKGKPQ